MKYIIDIPNSDINKWILDTPLGKMLRVPISVEVGRVYFIRTKICVEEYAEPDLEDIEDEIAERNQWRRNVAAIESVPSAELEQQWIPCSERLPEEETDVLVCNANGDIQISRGSYSTEMKDYFIWYTTGWRFGKVIAWMPLPEPYRDEHK